MLATLGQLEHHIHHNSLAYRAQTACSELVLDSLVDNVVEHLIIKARQNKDVFAGCNFWSWGGFAQTNVEDHEYWAKGDDYTGDPAQEQQGLNSIFVEDEATLDIIRETNRALGIIE